MGKRRKPRRSGKGRAWFRPFSMRSANTGATGLGQKYLADCITNTFRHECRGDPSTASTPTFGRYKSRNPVFISPEFIPVSESRARALAKMGQIERGGTIFNVVVLRVTADRTVRMLFSGNRFLFEEHVHRKNVTVRSIEYSNRDRAMALFKADKVTWIEVVSHD